MKTIYKIIGYYQGKQVKETESKYHDMAIAIAKAWEKYGVKTVIENKDMKEILNNE